MRLAIEGSLLSHDFLSHGLSEICGSAVTSQAHRFAMDRLHAAATLGPTAGASLVFGVAAAPLARWLGWNVPAGEPARTAAGLWTVLVRTGGHAIGMLAMPWAARSRDRHARDQPACARARPPICHRHQRLRAATRRRHAPVGARGARLRPRSLPDRRPGIDGAPGSRRRQRRRDGTRHVHVDTDAGHRGVGSRRRAGLSVASPRGARRARLDPRGD